MISDVSSQNALAKKWNGPSFWSPAVGRRGGVTVLCSPGMRDKISVWQKDAGGRLLSLLISFNNIRINLLNIYAPTNPEERKIFLQSIRPFLFPHSRVVIAGDFNCYDSILDKMGSPSIDSHFSEFKSFNFLRDAWRLKHPREKQFTWFNSNLSIASRLDSFLISRLLCEQVTTCQIYPCVYSDHDFVFLDLNLQGALRHGPGVWKFNNSLLQDEDFCSLIYELIEHFLNSRSSFPSDLIPWDRLKEEIKLVCINYSKEKWRQLSHEKVNIINRLILLKRRLAAGSDVKTEILDLEVRLNQLFERQLDGVQNSK